MAGHYNAGDLQVLEGLDAVRMRPGADAVRFRF